MVGSLYSCNSKASMVYHDLMQCSRNEQSVIPLISFISFHLSMGHLSQQVPNETVIQLTKVCCAVNDSCIIGDEK